MLSVIFQHTKIDVVLSTVTVSNHFCQFEYLIMLASGCTWKSVKDERAKASSVDEFDLQ